jgi:hypothetical protein
MSLALTFLGYQQFTSNNANFVIGPYTQPAGACIVVIGANITSINAPTDTLGNTYIPLGGTPFSLVPNSSKAGMWYVPNCLGGTNTIASIRGTSFGSWTAYYVTGADLVNPINIATAFEKDATSTSITMPAFSTTNPNTAIIAFLNIPQFSFTLPLTQPAGYTLDGSGSEGGAAHIINSTIQSGVTPGFSWAAGNVPAWMATVAVQTTPPPPSGGGSGLGYDFRYRFFRRRPKGENWNENQLSLRRAGRSAGNPRGHGAAAPGGRGPRAPRVVCAAR